MPEERDPLYEAALQVACLPALVDSHVARALRDEATRLRTVALPRERDHDVDTDGRLFGTVRSLASAAGPVLTAFHSSPDLNAVLEPLVGPNLVRGPAGYMIYRRGDFISLHLDQPACVLVVLIWLAGPAGPLHLHPELASLASEELVAVARRNGGHPQGGSLADLRHGPTVFNGSLIPHHRPPHDHDQELVVASLCFSR